MTTNYFAELRNLITRYTASVHLLLDLLWLSWAVSVMSVIAAALMCIYAARDIHETNNGKDG